jgi:hypothetical protein
MSQVRESFVIFPQAQAKTQIFLPSSHGHAWLFWNSVGIIKIRAHEAIVERRPDFGDALVQGL